LSERRPLSSPRAIAVSVLALLIAVVAQASAAGAAVSGPGRGAADVVVLISIDGLRWDYPRRAHAPTLARIAREGASAGSLIPTFPASTFPVHATLATGVHPDRHGILNNEFVDRERGIFRMDDDASWLLAEPLWVTAERQGVRTAVYHWVFSYTPWRGTAASVRIPFSRNVTDSEKVDRIIGWIGSSSRDRPRLILSYLHGPDGAGHREGPDSEAVAERVRRTDRTLGRLLRALDEAPGRIALVVVSDHGMSGVSRVHRMDRLLTGEARRVRVTSSGATSNLYCPDERACAAAAAILGGIEGMELFPMGGLPASWRYLSPARVGDLVAIAPAGSYFADGELEGRPAAKGMHGYPPEVPEMRGIFYAWGAGIRRGARREVVHAVDVVPLICRLLGIDPPTGIDGRAPEDLLAEPTSPAPPAGLCGRRDTDRL
jgi:predicted AlkP superfamily pyrophosphatase or phosphodiesterase